MKPPPCAWMITREQDWTGLSGSRLPPQQCCHHDMCLGVSPANMKGATSFTGIFPLCKAYSAGSSENRCSLEEPCRGPV